MSIFPTLTHPTVSLKFIAFALLIYCGAYAQESTLNITVRDSISEKPVEFVSVVLESNAQAPLFKSTNSNGQVFFTNLKPTSSIKLKFFLMGYVNKTIEKIVNPGVTDLQVLLKPDLERLDEVILEFKRPIIIKRDTVLFQADAFAKGNENKLRDLLKRMPGLEVDKSGNVKLNGKSVERLFVEGKLFFTGNEKLGVNNIPADAVEEVQLLDNFTDVAMLKKFEDTEELIMNLILKEDKKKLLFGDVAVGAGYEDRYKINPTLFYFSPEYSLNFIGDFSNTGQKSFTRNDYLDLNGGIRSMSPSAYFELTGDEFSRFLAENDNTQAVHRLGAAGYRRSWETTDINSYLIFDVSDLKQKSRTTNRYLSTNPFNENRNLDTEKDFSFLVSKTALEYKPDDKTDLRSVLFFKTNASDESSSVLSISPFQNTNLLNTATNDSFELNLDTQLTREIDSRNTIISEFKLKAKESRPELLWITDRPLNDQSIPYEMDNPFRLLQQVETDNYQLNFYTKHYYSINKNEQLHTTLVFNQYATQYENIAFQQLSDGSINNFESAGFNVNTTHNISLANASFEYRYNDDNWTLKPTLIVDYIYQNINQTAGEKDVNNLLLLPKVFAKHRFTNTSSFLFKYDRTVNLPNISQLVNRNYVSGLTSVSSGNPNLGIVTGDDISISYDYSNLWKGINLKLDFGYYNDHATFKPITVFDGLDQIRNFVRLDQTEDGFTYGGSFKKRINLISSQISVNRSSGNGFQIINGEILETQNESTRLGGELYTLFDEFPNLSASYLRTYSTYQNTDGISDFIQDRLSLTFDFDLLKHWNASFDYSYNYFKGEQTNTRSTYADSNFKISYVKEGSNWTYELNGTNLFDNEFEQDSSVNNFVISDTRTFIMPRMFLLTVAYKL